MLRPRIIRRHGLVRLVRVAREPDERLQLRVALVAVVLWDACFALFVRNWVPNRVHHAYIDAAFTRVLERRPPGPYDLYGCARPRSRALVIRVGVVGRRLGRRLGRRIGRRLGLRLRVGLGERLGLDGRLGGGLVQRALEQQAK